jgi:drug/metabolite transporter (DMT)-like permease
MLGLVGIGLITTTGEVDLSGQLAIGVLACLIATACYGCAGFLTRRWVTEREAWTPNWWPLAAR